ncbi:uncharacterized protein TNCV_1988551 [Trichonephila clavipes]|nr:uncharacterized protein TNCV_1988551 [Trichonephila clavipes]
MLNSCYAGGQKWRGQGYLGNFSCVIWNKLWPDLRCEKDFNDVHREMITDFVQSIPGFQQCDAEDCGFQMLNDDEIVTSV